MSFSDAHSGPKLGREATVFDLSELSYESIYKAIKQDGPSKIDYTIEFYPEEGSIIGPDIGHVMFDGVRKRRLKMAPPVLYAVNRLRRELNSA